MIIDAHCHLSGSDFEINSAVNAARNVGITKLFLGGVDPADWQNQLKIREKYGDIIETCFGLHPWFINRHDDVQCGAAFDLLLELISFKNRGNMVHVPIGIGETGLDHVAAKTPEEKSRQRHWFKKHLSLSSATTIPVVIHCVRAYGAIIDCLDESLEENKIPVSGMIHGFNGDRNLIERYTRRGILISLGPNAFCTRQQKDWSVIPDHLLTIESDAPHGSLNRRQRPKGGVDSSIVFEIATKLAEQRAQSETPEEILFLSAKNFNRVFG